MGSFETDLEIPDLKHQPLKISSIVLASQLQSVKKGAPLNPLIRDGQEIIPNVTHVFSATQHLRLYYEVYEPGRSSAAEKGSASSIHLFSNVSFFRGNAKVLETAPVELTELNARERKAGVFQLDLPLTSLRPGFYTCQVNVIDDAAGVFAFPRLALLIRTEAPTQARIEPAN
jgi:hypothetical protein